MKTLIFTLPINKKELQNNFLDFCVSVDILYLVLSLEFNMTYHKVIKSLLLSCLLAFANDLLADDDGTWTYTLSGDEATITGCVATCPTELVIPSTS